MKYIKSCIEFINDEQTSCAKEMRRILSLSDSAQRFEGQSIWGATVVGKTDQGTVLSFPTQATKLRSLSKVQVYLNKSLLTDTDVVSLDVKKNQVVLRTSLMLGQTVLIVAVLDITPGAILSSLNKLSVSPTPVVQNLINRNPNVKTYGDSSIPNILKTVSEMNYSFCILVGSPGAGKSFSGRAVIKQLLENGKTVAVTSNSHAAINNLCEGIDFEALRGVKICSSKSQQIKHAQFENVYAKGREIDSQVNKYNVLAGTCFALSRINRLKFDFLIVDEASQLKMSFLLAAARIAKNVVILGDNNQLQSINSIEMKEGGESVLDYLVGDVKILPSHLGYFLSHTYRMEPKITKLISDVFYEGKLTCERESTTTELKLVTSNHSNTQNMSEVEAQDVLKIYRSLRRKKIDPKDIMIITPYNAQVSLIKSLIKNSEVRIGTVDLLQGAEAIAVVVSMVVDGSEKESSSFVSDRNRINVAISRAISKVFIVASESLQKSKDTSEEFQQIVKMIA